MFYSTEDELARRQKSKETARNLIKNVIEFVNTDSLYGRDLWAILTALRGPDTNNMVVKALTTQKIRGAVGLSSNNSANAYSSEEKPEMILSLHSFETTHKENLHFINHHNYAVEALMNLGFIPQVFADR